MLRRSAKSIQPQSNFAANFVCRRTICLERGVRDLGKKAVTVQVLSGTAWLTQGTDDRLVQAGETYSAPASQHKLLISAPSAGQKVIFRVAE